MAILLTRQMIQKTVTEHGDALDPVMILILQFSLSIAAYNARSGHLTFSRSTSHLVLWLNCGSLSLCRFR